MNDPRYESYMGLAPQRIAHWEEQRSPQGGAHCTG